MSKIPHEHAGRYFYHFTHIHNLPTIIKHGLLCTKTKNLLGLEHVNVASEAIQERRSTMSVTCGPDDCVVHDYVPFYFCSVNPMFLSMVNSKNVDQNDFVIMAIPIERILKGDAVFTDASANTAVPPNFFSDPKDLVKLNWAEIDSQKWRSETDEARHQKMAEVLIYDSLPISDVEYLIFWNEDSKKEVTQIFADHGTELPKCSWSPFRSHNFFYTKFMVAGQTNQLLVTGPRVLRERYESVVNFVINKRGKRKKHEYAFDDLEDCLEAVRKNFCAINELEGIYELETTNDVHSSSVSDHTLEVVEELKKTGFFKKASKEDQQILELAAYLHDIGKGPAKKWRNGKQPAYPDHPADAAEMVARILHEEIRDLSKYQIRMLCLLVIYHDLIGEILFKGRNEQQLLDIIVNEHDFDMLATLNQADVAAIDWTWHATYNFGIAKFKKDILKRKGL